MANTIKIGSIEADAIKIGTSTVSKVYVGTELVYPNSNIDYTKEYLTFEPISSAVTYSHGVQTFQYSFDDGTTWLTCTTSQSVTVNVGQKMKLKGNFADRGSHDATNKFSAVGGTWKAYGNLLSLLYGDNFANQTVLNKNGLMFAFYGCQNLVNIDNLTIPIVSITTSKGLRGTFREIGVSSVPSDLLQATTIVSECYMGTFEGCVNLVKAPILPATNIPSYAYFALFNNCSSLNEVTCYATSGIVGNNTNLFLSGTASSGTFYKASSATWPTGQYGVPSGWTIENIS